MVPRVAGAGFLRKLRLLAVLMLMLLALVASFGVRAVASEWHRWASANE